MGYAWYWPAGVPMEIAGMAPVFPPIDIGLKPPLPVKLGAVGLPPGTSGTNWLALLIRSRLTVPGIPTTITVLFRRSFKRALMRVKSLSPVIRTNVEIVGRSKMVSIISISILRSTVLCTTVLCTIVLEPLALRAGMWPVFPVC